MQDHPKFQLVLCSSFCIVDLVPELKVSIGKQPAVPELPPQDRKAASSLCSGDSSAAKWRPCSLGRCSRTVVLDREATASVNFQTRT